MANFIRKHEDSAGVYRACLGSKVVDGKESLQEIVIEGRNIYSTDDSKEIKLLRNDEMILEVDPKAKVEAREED